MRRGWTRRALAAGLVGVLAACSGDDGGSAERQPDARPAYVALGDSISAGGGAPPYDQAVKRCNRSRDDAWPALVAAALEDVELTAMEACGGAKISHVLGAWEDLALAPQIPRDPDPSVELVTLTVGLNDIGYGSFLFICLQDCGSSTPEADAAYEARLDALRKTLVDDLYPSLRIAFPNARILHVGYPRLLASGPPVGCSWLEPAEQELANRAMDELNDTIEAAVAQAADDDLSFVDLTDALAGHEMCSADPWVVGLEDGPEGGHPTAEGYDAIADSVLAVLRSP